jgi:hypothetical protein
VGSIEDAATRTGGNRSTCPIEAYLGRFGSADRQDNDNPPD